VGLSYGQQYKCCVFVSYIRWLELHQSQRIRDKLHNNLQEQELRRRSGGGGGFKFPLHTINKNILKLGLLGGKGAGVAPREGG
jgi:hypothetical protein